MDPDTATSASSSADGPELDPELDKEDLVCFCHAVPTREIVAAIDRGAHKLHQIQAETLASTGCGGCECEVLELLERRLARLSKN